MKDFEIKLGAYNLPVTHHDQKDLEDVFDDDEHVVFGCYMGARAKPEIRMWKELTGVRYNGVFNHELLEAINTQYGLGLQHSQIELIGEALTQVYTDSNGKLSFLTKSNKLK